MRRQRAELRLRRRRHLRRRPTTRTWPPAPGVATRLIDDLRAGRLAGRRGAAARGQPRPAGAHARQPPRLLPAVGPDLGVPGAAQGPRRPPATARWRRSGSTALAAAGLARGRAARGGRGRPGDAPPDHRQRAAARAGARDQARAGRAARHRVRRAAAAARARPGRRDAARRRPRCRPCARWSPAATSAGPTARRCCAAYRFLRTVEHRLQLQRLRRTHTVPADPAALRWLAARAGLHGRCPAATRSRRSGPTGSRHASEVRRLHAKLLYRPLLEAVARVPAEALRLTPEAARRRLEVLGFADPAGALRHLEALTGGVSRTAAIQRTLLPVLLQEFADAAEPDRGLLATARSPTSSAPRPGTCGCCATRARWRCGWPGCSASPGTSPTCSPATRRRCGCWPTTPSCAPRAGDVLARRASSRRPTRHADPAEAIRAVRGAAPPRAVPHRLRRRAQPRIARPGPADRRAGVGIGTGRCHRRDARRRAAGGVPRQAAAGRAAVRRSSAWAGWAGAR